MAFDTSTQTHHKLDIISEGTSLVASPFAEINVAQINVGSRTYPLFKNIDRNGTDKRSNRFYFSSLFT